MISSSRYLYAGRAGGRCADGFERDGGRLFHVVETAEPRRPSSHAPALCDFAPGRLSIGWDFVNLEIPAAVENVLGCGLVEALVEERSLEPLEALGLKICPRCRRRAAGTIFAEPPS